ncbi:MAG: hypothetical protein ACPLPS_08665 [bacterium]
MNNRNLIIIIFVEGTDDKDFFEAIIKRLLLRKYEEIRIITYKQRGFLKDTRKEKMSQFIMNLKSMGRDYIFVADINDAPCITKKKGDLMDIYKGLDTEKIVVVVKEIESWYLAGIPEELANELKFSKPLPLSTDGVRKEDFKNITGRDLGDIDFKQQIIENFCIPSAEKRNKSFAYFMRKFCKT